MKRLCLTLLLCGLAENAAAASRPAVEATHGMVVSAQRLASEAGVEILKEGGNAIDAAVAVGYAEAVVNPCCGNIGGGGFMVLRLADGREVFINFRETAPGAATAGLYLDAEGRPVKEASRRGYKAAGVPGTVAGFDAALGAYGTMSRAQVMAPAIRLARDGFVLTRFDTDILGFGTELFRHDKEAARIFLRPDGSPWRAGDRLVQADLAATLSRIAADGPNVFYRGPVAKAVAAASAAGGGILTAADFAQYHTTESQPLGCRYRGYDIASAPPPSSGGVTLCEMLDILGGYDLKSLGFGSAAAIHVLAEAMRHAYRDRNNELGDPAFVQNPLQRLLSAEYAESIRKAIPPEQATPSKDLPAESPPAQEKSETTHYSIMDKQGNAVAVTYTLNGGFGAGVIAPGTGFFLNDEMDDFTVKPGTPNMFGLVQGTVNAIAPGKRPLSSMTPTIVTKDGKVAFVLGSPGGSRITTAVLLTLVDLIDFGMRPEEAVDAPRIHQQWLPDTVFAERFAISPDTRKILESDGYSITDAQPGSDVELIVVGPESPAASTGAGNGADTALSGALMPGLLYGASDDRRPAGAAVGY